MSDTKQSIQLKDFEHIGKIESVKDLFCLRRHTAVHITWNGGNSGVYFLEFRGDNCYAKFIGSMHSAFVSCKTDVNLIHEVRNIPYRLDYVEEAE